MSQDQFRARRRGRTALMHAALGGALAVMAVCTATSAARAGDDGEPPSFYDKVLGVIGLHSEGQDINYGERSPLVVPPTKYLPPPTADAPPSSPAWPKDPDVQRRAQAKIKAKFTPQKDRVVDDGRVLSPAELGTAGPLRPVAAAPAGTASPSTSSAEAPPQQPKRSIFSMPSWLSKEEYATFTGEPPRSNLTDPPVGYLTPSPDQPYGIGPAQKKTYEAPTVADRVTPQR